MRGNWLTPVLVLALALVSACGAARGAPSSPESLPSPEGSWTVQLTQTGGFAGVRLWVEVTSAGKLTATDQRTGRTITQTLPNDALARLRRLVAQADISGSIKPSTSCADCFLYELVFTSDSGTKRLQADDVTVGESGAQDLIALLRSLRDKALTSGP